jgi:hypothetical protein
LRRADGAFLDDFHRRGQRAGTQQQREVVRLTHGHRAGDLEAVAQLAVDRGSGEHFALALLEDQHGHALLVVLDADLPHDVAALRVHRQVDLGLVGLLLEAGLRVGEVLAGDQHLLLHDHGAAGAVEEFLGTERHRARALFGRAAFGAFVHQAHLERGGAADDGLGLRRVLHAGQLHDDAVEALLLDHRFGHAEFVDPVVQRRHVLLERRVLEAARRFGLDAGHDARFGALLAFDGAEVRHLVLQHAPGDLQAGGVAQGDLHGLAVAVHRAATHLLVAQAGADVAGEGLGLLVQHAAHVDLQQEVDPAAQIEAQVHREGMQRRQPMRRARHEVQRHHIGGFVRVRHQRLLQRVARLDLVVRGDEARPHGGRLQRQQVGGETGRLEHLFDPGLGRGIDLDGGLGRRHLHRRRLAEEIGQGVDEPHEQHDHDDRVLPDRVTVHEKALFKKRDTA